MSDFLNQFVNEKTLWRQGTWRPASLFRNDTLSLAEKLHATESVFPDFRDNHLFLACLLAGLLVQAPLLLLSDRSQSTLSRLRTRYKRLMFVTDENNAAPAGVDEQKIHVALGNKDNETFINYRPASDQLVLEAQTSGSTNEPRVYRKSWSGLLTEADIIGQSLRLTDTGQHIIPTVPLHHMYGFAYALFGPLRWGMSIDAERPVFPRDLSRVLAAAPSPAWVVTTPIQLRAYVASTEKLPQLAGFICSAAPLPVDLARLAEERFGCPVIETYGSTETGAVAWRHPTHTDIWTTYQTLTLSTDGQTRVFADHLPKDGQVIDDCIELLDENRFRIIGRTFDLVKVAGKRASLSGLSEMLRSIDGVEDGTFLQPPDKDGQTVDSTRLAAFVVLRDREPEAILALLREQIDPVFLPRPFIPVPELPRNANGKLPRSALEDLWQKHAQ